MDSGSDEATRSTNDDASLCKRFAVQKGYWCDPYIEYLVRTTTRKAPEISRGYYARTQSVKVLVDQFLQITNRHCQIVNLGAGFDTLYWRLTDEGRKPTRLIDVDFHAVTSKKCYLIKNRKPLLDKINPCIAGVNVKFDAYDMHSEDYHVIGVDLRNINDVESKMSECNIDSKLPTLFLAECVLVYMDTDKSSTLLKSFSDKFDTAFFVNYEQVNMGDRFGQVMVENLRGRQCTLSGIDACASIDSQIKRFTDTGWTDATCVDMLTAYHSIPQADVQRIEKLEFMDEQELLVQLLQHYCISWAYKDPVHVGLANINLHSWNTT